MPPNRVTLNGVYEGREGPTVEAEDSSLNSFQSPLSKRKRGKKRAAPSDVHAYIADIADIEDLKNMAQPLCLLSNDTMATFIKLTAVKCLCRHRGITGVMLCSSSFDGMSVPPSDVVAEASLQFPQFSPVYQPPPPSSVLNCL